MRLSTFAISSSSSSDFYVLKAPLHSPHRTTRIGVSVIHHLYKKKDVSWGGEGGGERPPNIWTPNIFLNKSSIAPKYKQLSITFFFFSEEHR